MLKNREFSLKLQISIMLSIAVSKMGMTELIFVDPGMKVNGHAVLPRCFTVTDKSYGQINYN